MEKDIHKWVNLNSTSAIWYRNATQLLPPPITKHTPRDLAVTIHRLRLGYKACWEIIDNNIPCSYCERETPTPLLHYLLECPETNSIRNNQDTPNDIQSPQSLLSAAKLVNKAVEGIEQHIGILCSKPPPR